MKRSVKIKNPGKLLVKELTSKENRPMSSKLINALDRVKSDHKITLGELAHELRGDALMIICLVCILPFMQPIPIPGLSSLLGLVIVMQGLALIISDKPLLTEKLKGIELDPKKFEIIYKAAKKFSYLSSKLATYPMPAIVLSRANKIVTGILIILMAAFLSLPLPIPFSNFIPAIGIFFLCLGILEEDIILSICGQMISVVIIVLVYISGNVIWEQFENWLV